MLEVRTTAPNEDGWEAQEENCDVAGDSYTTSAEGRLGAPFIIHGSGSSNRTTTWPALLSLSLACWLSLA